MADIDLIPSDYRRLLWLRHHLFVFGMICGGLIVLVAGSHIALGHVLGGVNVEIQHLQVQQKITMEQREELARREKQKQGFQHQLALLESLRSGAAAEKMFITIDRALEGEEVWFSSWEFQRAGEMVKDIPQTVNTGYFIVVPAGEGRKQPETWKIETHMTIRGQAHDHAVLSRFVRRLISQPEIQDVRILKTGVRNQTKRKTVDFEMAVVVNSGAVAG